MSGRAFAHRPAAVRLFPLPESTCTHVTTFEIFSSVTVLQRWTRKSSDMIAIINIKVLHIYNECEARRGSIVFFNPALTSGMLQQKILRSCCAFVFDNSTHNIVDSLLLVGLEVPRTHCKTVKRFCIHHVLPLCIALCII